MEKYNPSPRQAVGCKRSTQSEESWSQMGVKRDRDN